MAILKQQKNEEKQQKNEQKQQKKQNKLDEKIAKQITKKKSMSAKVVQL